MHQFSRLLFEEDLSCALCPVLGLEVSGEPCLPYWSLRIVRETEANLLEEVLGG